MVKKQIVWIDMFASHCYALKWWNSQGLYQSTAKFKEASVYYIHVLREVLEVFCIVMKERVMLVQPCDFSNPIITTADGYSFSESYVKFSGISSKVLCVWDKNVRSYFVLAWLIWSGWWWNKQSRKTWDKTSILLLAYRLLAHFTRKNVDDY